MLLVIESRNAPVSTGAFAFALDSISFSDFSTALRTAGVM